MSSSDLCISAEDFPLEILRYSGQPAAIVKPGAYGALPFSARSCSVEAIHSLEEFNGAGPVERPWAVKLRISVSLCSASTRHWLVLSPGHGGGGEGCWTIGFDGNVKEAAATVEATLLQAADTPLQHPGKYEGYLMSEPPSTTRVAQDSLDASTTAMGVEELVQSERVVFGDTVVDVARALSDVFSAHNDGDPHTAILWPAPLSFPVNVHSSSTSLRVAEHVSLLLPPRIGLLHTEQKLQSGWDHFHRPQTTNSVSAENASGRGVRCGVAWERHLVSDPHTTVKVPVVDGAGPPLIASGSYDYYHYRIDGFNDDEWGCAYRSLQTLLSWFQHAGWVSAVMPSLREIQQILSVADPDKASKKGFVGSRDWIGSFEVMLVLQHFLPQLECTIQRLESGSELDTNPAIQQLLVEHFSRREAPPVMIGGSSYAHTIAGVIVNSETLEARYLIVDPHYSSSVTQIQTAVKKGFVGWKNARKFFEANSWYNLCIPRVDSYDPR